MGLEPTPATVDQIRQLVMMSFSVTQNKYLVICNFYPTKSLYSSMKEFEDLLQIIAITVDMLDIFV